MQITLEAVEKVMELTGVDYAGAKEALIKADGNVDEAVKLITPGAQEGNDKVKETVEKIKAKVKEGNVDKVQISKDGEIVLSLPVNIGIIGGIVGLAAAPWAFIAASIATLGFGCKVEIVKKDGSTDEIV
jgi:translation elongation factor EF-Ts